MVLCIFYSQIHLSNFLLAFCIFVLECLGIRDVWLMKLFNVYPVFLTLFCFLFMQKTSLRMFICLFMSVRYWFFSHYYKTCIILSTDMGHWEFSTLECLAIIDLKNLKIAFKRLSLYPIRNSNVHLSLCMSLGFNLEEGFTDDNLFSFLIWLKNQFWCMVSCMHACVCGGKLLYLV